LYLCGVGILALGAAWFLPWKWKSGGPIPDANAAESQHNIMDTT
jgi:hypothetical protein